MSFIFAVLIGVLQVVMPPPVLGGSPAAFEQILGAPNSGTIGASLHYLRCAGSDIDQFIILAPNDQVWTVQREFCGSTAPSFDERLAEATQYLPADAQLIEPFTSGSGEAGWIFVSPSLGSVLPAALFHDCVGQTVALGSLFIVAETYGGWFMGPGTCA
jgi:hypothetical protein